MRLNGFACYLYLASTVLSVAITALPAMAGDQCGCDYAEPGCCAPARCCHRHCCRRGFVQDRGLDTRTYREAPVAPIVEARYVPVMQSQYLVADVPMVRAAPRAEVGCEGSSARLDLLEERFKLLRSEVDEIRTTMKLQTEILTSIKTKLDGIAPAKQ